MTATCGRIGELVLQIQDLFLDTPGLRLTPAQVETRFGLDEMTCHALLAALTDARVLARTGDGVYALFGFCVQR